MQLRNYQVEAADAIDAELSRARSTLLVLATGLGKTVTFSEVARRFIGRGGRVLVLAHRGELLDQAASTLRRFGLSVGIEQADQRVDPAALPDVTIASVQTLQGKRRARFARDAFALIVVDEAHHATAASYRAILDHFDGAKVLGVTATPDRADGVGLRNVFASVAYRVELAQGIASGYLAPIELRSVIVDSLDLSRVRSVAGDLAVGDLERELTRDGVLHEVAAPLAELSAGRQTIAFVAGVQQAHALADVLGGYGVAAAAVDGSMTSQDRAGVLDSFRSGRVQVVCNAQLWTEGFDAPETSCVALVRPTRSRALLVQMIGRGTRLADGKASCLVLDFVPGRASRMRLAAPADVLAGEDLPEPLLDRVRALSRIEGVDLGSAIERAKRDQAEADAANVERQRAEQAERMRLVREVGVAYVAPRIDVAQLLEAVAERSPHAWVPPWQSAPASSSQVAALRNAGFDVPDSITRKDASALFDVLAQRRRAGLCSLKAAKKLRSYGLRDDLPTGLAREALDAIAANGWKPPTWLFRDERFTIGRAA